MYDEIPLFIEEKINFTAVKPISGYFQEKMHGKVACHATQCDIPVLFKKNQFPSLFSSKQKSVYENNIFVYEILWDK